MGGVRVLMAILAAGVTARQVGASSRAAPVASTEEAAQPRESSPGPFCEEEAEPRRAAAPVPSSALPPVPLAGGLIPLPIPWAAPLPEPIEAAPAEPAHVPTTFEEKWPVEYVLRPQTLPGGALRPAISGDYFEPQAGPLYTPSGNPYTFHPSLTVGASVTYGATDRLQLGVLAPRLFCFDGSQPSGCNDLNRANGSGVSVGYGLVRTRPFQLETVTSFSVWRTDPLTLEWAVSLRGKVLFGEVVALELEAAASRPFDANPAYHPYLQFTGVTDLNVQLTRHLLVYADLDPYAPAGRLDDPAVEGLAGMSWTFEDRADLSLRAGVYDLFGARAWQNSVPGTFYVFTLGFFL